MTDQEADTRRDQAEEPLTISKLLRRAKNQVHAWGTFKVLGEISGFKGPHARSGHVYFSLKDETASMDVIMWRNTFASCAAPLKDGLQVEVEGSFDIFEPTGRLSFIIKKLSVAGEGILRQQVAELARKLQAEGWMAQERKKPVPVFCEKICVITSLSGAVIDDVKKTLLRRNPLVKIIVIGASVQGEGAPQQLQAALAKAQGLDVDAILLVRGGGSYEDLMAFNDEALARAVATSHIPVVTGIGHEPDISIADMVADRSMSTPTAAAESIAPAKEDLLAYLQTEEARITKNITACLRDTYARIASLFDRGTERLQVRIQSLIERLGMLSRSGVLSDPFYNLKMRKETLLQNEERLVHTADAVLHKRTEDLNRARMRLLQAGKAIAQPLGVKVSHLAHTLDTLNPDNVLSRGYAIVEKNSHAISSVLGLVRGEDISLRLSDGTIEAAIKDIHQKSGDTVRR